MKKNLFNGAFLCVLGLSSIAANGASFFSNFNGSNGRFNKAAFLFRGEQNMNVDYGVNRISRDKTKAILRAGRRNFGTRESYGSWFQTTDLLPIGALCEARCRIAEPKGNNANARRASWSAFWTLYDQTIERRLNTHYHEQDILETFPNGNYFNRYVYKNYQTNAVRTTGGIFPQNGVAFWRDQWRVYSCNWGAISSTFKVTGKRGRTKVVTGPNRIFTQRMILQNRPWGGTLDRVRQNQAVGTLYCDYANGFTP